MNVPTPILHSPRAGCVIERPRVSGVDVVQCARPLPVLVPTPGLGSLKHTPTPGGLVVCSAAGTGKGVPFAIAGSLRAEDGRSVQRKRWERALGAHHSHRRRCVMLCSECCHKDEHGWCVFGPSQYARCNEPETVSPRPAGEGWEWIVEFGGGSWVQFPVPPQKPVLPSASDVLRSVLYGPGYQGPQGTRSTTGAWTHYPGL